MCSDDALRDSTRNQQAMGLFFRQLFWASPRRSSQWIGHSHCCLMSDYWLSAIDNLSCVGGRHRQFISKALQSWQTHHARQANKRADLEAARETYQKNLSREAAAAWMRAGMARLEEQQALPIASPGVGSPTYCMS